MLKLWCSPSRPPLATAHASCDVAVGVAVKARGMSASMNVVAAIEEPGAIKKILTHQGLSPHPPPKPPSRYDPFAEGGVSVWHPALPKAPTFGALPPTPMWSYSTF